MNAERENLIRRYFSVWIEAPETMPDDIFTENVVYTECYGPEYHGKAQLDKWYAGWIGHGRVLRWDIKRFLHDGDMCAVEWFFEWEYDGQRDCFDGVSLIRFDADERISEVREFQSKSEHIFPFDE